MKNEKCEISACIAFMMMLYLPKTNQNLSFEYHRLGYSEVPLLVVAKVKILFRTNFAISYGPLWNYTNRFSQVSCAVRGFKLIRSAGLICNGKKLYFVEDVCFSLFFSTERYNFIV